MKILAQLVFTILFSCCVAVINAPLFNDNKHEIFAKTTHEWIIVHQGIKCNGLQKFTILTHEIWALNIEKAIQKLGKRFGEFPDFIKADGVYFVFMSVES